MDKRGIEEIGGSAAKVKRVASLYKAKKRSRLRCLPPKRAHGFDKRNKKRCGGVLGESGAVWQMAAASLHDDVLLDSVKCYE